MALARRGTPVTPPSHTTAGARATNERVTYGQHVPGVVRFYRGEVSFSRCRRAATRPAGVVLVAAPEALNRAVAGRGMSGGGPPISRSVCGQLTCSLETLIGALQHCAKVSTA